MANLPGAQVMLTDQQSGYCKPVWYLYFAGLPRIPAAPGTIVAATYAIADSDSYLIADFAGTVTLTLPTAGRFPGRAILIKTVQAQAVDSDDANVVPLAGGAAGASILAATAGKWATLVSDSTNWQIMAAN